MVAYMHAQGVPMAVPISWYHHVSLDWKIFVVMTRDRSSIMKPGVGKEGCP